MTQIIPPGHWNTLPRYYVASNWILDYDGTEVAMGNRGAALRAQSDACNHMLARMPRPVFQVSRPFGQVLESSIDPIYLWKLMDDFDNALRYTVHIVCWAPTAEPSDYVDAFQYAGSTFYVAGTKATLGYQYLNASHDRCEDLQYQQYSVFRGSVTDAEALDGISTANGYGVISVTVYEDPLDRLDTSKHVYAHPTKTRRGYEMLADGPQNIREAIHERRTTGLPQVFWWAAQGVTAERVEPGDERGLHTTSASYLNAFDDTQTIAARSTTSPGFVFNAQNCGRGPTSLLAGQRVKVECRVLARAVGGEGKIKYQGPNTWANNYCEISIPDGAGLQWYGSSNTFMYLDTQQPPTNVTSLAMNKIDPFIKVTAGDLYVYGMSGRMVYE